MPAEESAQSASAASAQTAMPADAATVDDASPEPQAATADDAFPAGKAEVTAAAFDAATASHEPAPAPGAATSAGDDMEVAVVPGITRYHLSDCLLIRFLTGDDLDLMSRQAARDSGCFACKACKPDQEPADAAAG